ncbi:STAS domain-containing protein [Cytobacillus purgationiresistens]|uniref:RsbT co-antagonist protein RsbR n=1 Tax=Cytobacillus purgationiresistens TaxID=863449 RepID=A0ABU0AJH7_9BACI|nr:STAS domain-containing protein [Cytobacillus purgationiresistens]MDQ0271418.1 rsbT co-antagonist protein RsbR [Cytobacillus purgationiresistens]
MIISEQLHDYLMRHSHEITQTWLDSRKDDGSIYSKNSTYEVTELLREQNQKFLKVVIQSLIKNVDYVCWAEEVSSDRAKSQTPLHISLQNFKKFRGIFWGYLVKFAEENKLTIKDLGQLGDQINYTFDHIIELFSMNYQKVNDLIVESHREVIVELSSPIIKLNESIGILPLVGGIDTHRARVIKENVLSKSKELLLDHLIIDLSGVPYFDTMVANEIFQIEKMLSLLGISVALTGIQPTIANTSIQLGLDFKDICTYATVQKALPKLLGE